MKIIFAGTPQFAASILQSLLEGPHEIVLVLTQPDRPKGRGRELHTSPVKQLAMAHQIPCLQPSSLKNKEIQDNLQTYNADLMVVAAYGLILPQSVLDIPRCGCLNVHASLLPRWRGAAPIQYALLHDEPETGITIMQMDAGLDTGDILWTKTCPISADETTDSLTDKLMHLGGLALNEALEKLVLNQLQARAQDDSLTCHAPKISKQDALLNWQLPARQLACRVRAFKPWPGAYTYHGFHTIKILEASILNRFEVAQPGTIVGLSPDGVLVQTGQGLLALTRIQLAGGKALAFKALWHGRQPFKLGDKFTLGPA